MLGDALFQQGSSHIFKYKCVCVSLAVCAHACTCAWVYERVIIVSSYSLCLFTQSSSISLFSFNVLLLLRLSAYVLVVRGEMQNVFLCGSLTHFIILWSVIFYSQFWTLNCTIDTFFVLNCSLYIKPHHCTFTGYPPLTILHIVYFRLTLRPNINF